MEQEDGEITRKPTSVIAVVIPNGLLDAAMRITGRSQSETIRRALARFTGHPDEVAVLRPGRTGGRARKRRDTEGEQ